MKRKKTPHVRDTRQKAMFSSKFLEDLSLEELRFRRDMAMDDGDRQLALTCALLIDKKRGLAP